METILSQIFNLLVEPPGNLVYHLVLVFATLSALQAVTLLERSDNRRLASRYRIGFLIILFAQVSLFGVSALGWQNLVDLQVVLPPLDRAVIAITLLWIAWIVLSSQRIKLLDWAAAALTVAIVAYSAITMDSWSHVVGQVQFNTTALDFNWAAIYVGSALVFGTLIVFLRPPNWGTGLGIYILVFIGGWLHFSTPSPDSDYAAALRLALICIFPLLPGLTSSLRASRSLQADESEQAAGVTQRQLQAYSYWSQLASVVDRQTALPLWVKALGYSFGADSCLLVIQENQDAPPIVKVGYDLEQGKNISPPVNGVEGFSQLEKIVKNGEPHRLQGSREESVTEKEFLDKVFSTAEEQNYLIIPVPLKDAFWGCIIMSMRASRGEWTGEEAENIQNLCIETGKDLNHLPSDRISDQEISVLQKDLERAKTEVLEIRQEQRLLLEEMDSIRFERESSALNLSMDSLMAVQRETHDTIAALEAENELLRKKVREVPAVVSEEDSQYLEQELRASLEETAHLQNALAEASITIMNLQRTGGQSGPFAHDAQNNLLSAFQKMYNPVSTLVAYTNLLSSESGHKLDSLQINYLERIQKSTDQLREAMNEVVHKFSQTNHPVELAPQPIAMDTFIDQAIGEITPLLTEKNIHLHLNLPEELPEVYADRDALQQIIIYLLQNAAAATPENGMIGLKVRIDKSETDSLYMVLQVTDEGGGVPAEEIGKVFNREYRSEHPQIQGIMDAGTGLVVARTLVEAHNGRIWVECDTPNTSTYSVIFPLENQPKIGLHQPS